ncbi:hypothetical protein AMJ86_04725 [bacterium SM23_57]|jgi:hypothetical protein|nr:MAG: hypothetical protein AMJ86_04725 [bacterium SM23_57]
MKIPPVWSARILVGVVMVINVQSAIAFLMDPVRYAPAYELIGIPGKAAIQGFGILFMMWNVPYAVAFFNPFRHRISLYEADIMQLIGLIGETFIYIGLPPGNLILKDSLLRFMIFDGLGLLVLLLATIIVRVNYQRE